MAQFGSRTTSVSQNLSAVQDPQGNLIVSPDNSFGASPLGIAARTQALYGIPNANFNLLPEDSTAEIATGNELPYWKIVNLGAITATMSFDETAQAWGVLIDPSSAGSGDSLSLTTRSYLLNDSNLSLRQKAFASITKIGTMATSQWDLVMNATYYDSAGSALSTYAIGTANSGTTWTSINGFTTTGTAIIDAAAQYLDLDLTLTTTTAVTGTAKVDLNSVLLQTSTGGGGGAQSFLITETFTSSGTFTVPTGVNYVDVVGIGAGGGGMGGAINVGSATTRITSATTAEGGAQAYWALRREIYVGNVSSVTVGIGAGGTGGTARTFTKASGTITQSEFSATNGGSAGATTFGTYLSIPGANGASPGDAPTGWYGLDSVAGSGAQVGGSAITHPVAKLYSGAPFTTFVSGTANAGTAGTGSGGTGTASAGGAGGTALGIAGIGGYSFRGTAASSSSVTTGGAGGGGGGGGAGGSSMRYINGASQTIVATGGGGGNAIANTGSGGGGGGNVAVAASGTANYSSATITATTGKGGDGASGFIVVAYIA